MPEPITFMVFFIAYLKSVIAALILVSYVLALPIEENPFRPKTKRQIFMALIPGYWVIRFWYLKLIKYMSKKISNDYISVTQNRLNKVKSAWDKMPDK